jgi:very-short-patch-repair endonuclease
MPKKLTADDFLSRSKKIHRNFYEYENIEYKNNRSIINIICPKHGRFKQKAYLHLNGAGCILCYRDRQRSSTDVFIKKAKKIHKSFYDYSKTIYLGANEKVKITCPTHGDFEQLPWSHIGQEQCGCPTCYLDGHRTSTKKLIIECSIAHKNFYDYSKVIYLNPRKKIKIICPDHGEFQQLPFNHRAGQGCPRCATNVSNKETDFLDFLMVDDNNRQKRIKNFLVDAFLPDKKIIYEFLGDFWHGNPKLYDCKSINKVNKTSFGELYEKTVKRFNILTSMGYTVKYVWESEWDVWKKNKRGDPPIITHNF